MKETQVVQHANLINLARRLTSENENDLVQIDFLGDAEDKAVSPRKFDHAYCAEMSNHLLHAKYLPEECNKFQDVVTYLKRRETDTTPNTADLS